MHGFGEVDTIEHPHLIFLPLQESPALVEGAALRVHHHIRGMGLKELRGQPEPCLARAGRADDAGVQVAGVVRIFRPGVDGEQLLPGGNDIIFKLVIDKRLDVLFRSRWRG